MFVMLTIRRSHFLSTRCPTSPAHLSKSLPCALHRAFMSPLIPAPGVSRTPLTPFPGSFPGIYPGRGNVCK